MCTYFNFSIGKLRSVSCRKGWRIILTYNGNQRVDLKRDSNQVLASLRGDWCACADRILAIGVGMLPDVMIGVGVHMVPNTEVIVMATPAITLEFVADVLAIGMTGAVPATNVDMLAGENADGLATVATLLEFTLPAS